MTKHKGRGVFALKDIKNDEILIVEKAMATHNSYDSLESLQNPYNIEADSHYIGKTELTKKCKGLLELNGIQALKMSYMFTDNVNNQTIPPMEIYTNN